jgi:hypothetical protein
MVASREFDSQAAQAGLVVLSLVVLILFVYGWWASWSEAYWLGAALLATCLLLITVRSAWHLGHWHAIERPYGFTAEIAHPEVRQLMKDIETLSAQRTGDPHQLAIAVEDAVLTQPSESAPRFAPIVGPHPVLGWYLREFRNVTWSPRAEVVAGSRPSPLAITFAGTSEGDGAIDDGTPEGYVGSKYGLASGWLPADLGDLQQAPTDFPQGWDGAVARFREAWRMQIQPWLRWAVYRRAEVQPQVESVILWASASP